MSQSRTYKLLDVASMFIIILVVFIMGMFAYVRFWPVDVIRNDTWKLTVASKEYRAGDSITVNIVSDKVRSVGGYFTTTAECKNDKGVFVSYPISEQHVNRSVGHVETAIETKLPVRVTPLPTTCRIAYILEYSVYSFRSFSEYNFTNEFTLQPPLAN